MQNDIKIIDLGWPEEKWEREGWYWPVS